MRDYLTIRPGSLAWLAAIVLLTVAALAGCSSPAVAPPRAASSPSAAQPQTDSPPAPAAHAAVPAPAPRVRISHVRTADGARITVATFTGPVRFVLHNGSSDPGPAAAGVVRAGPAIVGSERRRLLAAFNGGFQLNTGAGGYEQEGHVISPLQAGDASLVIDTGGTARIGVWGQTVPRPGEHVYSVRQNLTPLVRHGMPTPAAYVPAAWGATLGGGDYVARSALGENAAGQLVFAGSMSATALDLARALVRHGVRIAMELDINPEWVQLDVARRPGGHLVARLPGQNRPADQYLIGWTRDFIAVLGR